MSVYTYIDMNEKYNRTLSTTTYTDKYSIFSTQKEMYAKKHTFDWQSLYCKGV